MTTAQSSFAVALLATAAVAGCPRARGDRPSRERRPRPIVASLAAGLGTSCAVTVDGAVYCWGLRAERNQHGPGEIRLQGEPQRIVGIPRAAAVGVWDSDRATVLATDGRVLWGFLGPRLVETSITDGVEIASCVGTVDTWVRTRTGGVVALDPFSGRFLLTPVVFARDAIALAPGRRYECALGAGGVVRCRTPRLMIEPGVPAVGGVNGVVAGLPPIARLAAGCEHVCALATTGEVYCLGSNAYGELGQGTLDAQQHPVPIRVPGLGGVREVTSGDGFSCALLADGAVWCWGRNTSCQVGNKFDGPARPTPARVAGLGAVRTVVAGGWHACALEANGRVACWGNNGAAELGRSPQFQRSTCAPVEVQW